MKKSIGINFIIMSGGLICFGILIGIPFDKEDLTLTYFCSTEIVKEILGAACIIAIILVCRNELKYKNHKQVQ